MMIIDKIAFKNFRGFKGQRELILDKRLNVFVGMNGSGKSSLLDLAAILLNQFTVRMLAMPHWGSVSRQKQKLMTLEYTLNDFDIHQGETETVCEIFVLFTPKSILNIYTSWQLKHGFADVKKSKNDFSSLNEIIANYRIDLYNESGDWDSKPIPVLKYFHSTRIIEQKTDKTQNHKPFENPFFLQGQVNAYEHVFEKKHSFNEFILWFIGAENQENREKVLIKDFDYFLPELSVVREAISSFLGYFSNAKYENLRVSESYQSKAATLSIDKNGKTLAIQQLSDGEKNLILMVAEIARLLALANPRFKSPLDGNGIVLIDEIDLHLHPAWQREVIPGLMRTFTNIQFIVSTHSPQVLSNVKPRHIFMIGDFDFKETAPFTFGNDSNHILEDVFGVPGMPEHTRSKLEALFDLIDEAGDRKPIVEKLTELEGQLGSNHPEIVRAWLHLNFLNDIQEQV